MAVIAAFGFVFGKSYFETTWQKLAETERARELSYKSEMGKIDATKQSIEELTVRIEQVKSTFDLNRITYQIQFSKLNERRMVVIETLYEKLFRLQSATDVFTLFIHPIITDAEAEAKARLDEVQNAYNDLRSYFLGKMILFSDKINSKLSDIARMYWDCLWDSTGLLRLRNFGATGQQLKPGFEKADAARERFAKEIPKALTAIDLELKKLLGVIKDAKSE